MYRTALQYLLEWKTRPTRKPLIVRGARQVGKSYLVRALASQGFANLLEINLETDLEAPSLFRSRDPETILELLEARYGVKVVPGETLLFLDEIQAAPELISCLRYFHEKLNQLHVVAAGSLLDFALNAPRFSVPVGRIEYLHLGPMTFEEFLGGMGKEGLLKFINQFEPGQEVVDSIHEELMRLVRQFVLVGGMPEAVGAFARSGRLSDTDGVKQSILTTFREDFGKYGGPVDHRHIDQVFVSIPRQVGRKFVYAHVDRNVRAPRLAAALDMLCMARVGSRVCHTAANGVPLGAEAQPRWFKVLFLDVGLLCRSLGLGILDVESAEDVMHVNAGAVCEQLVGQELLCQRQFYEPPELFCWMRQKSQSSAEIDYVVSLGEHVVPVEVKAGKTGRLKSLHVFLQRKKRTFGLRFNSDKPSLLDSTTSLANQEKRPFMLLSLPLYMAGQTRRLLRAALTS